MIRYQIIYIYVCVYVCVCVDDNIYAPLPQ